MEDDCDDEQDTFFDETDEEFDGSDQHDEEDKPVLVIEPQAICLANMKREHQQEEFASNAGSPDVKLKYSSALTYFVTCSSGPKNARTVNVLDVNDNPPIFQSKTYSITLPEMTAVGLDVLKVTAIDKDASITNNRETAS
ncbi:hypothetical protein PO909_016030 [Leuciscus waleckii]